ncbi:MULTISPECIES: S1 family peptidase [Actinomadura]|uniref:S1 family peptidase n=1 Tax=Actinomadura yumaensis TaxID=111807 RepID=A0ABW2CQG7_9ACTN|nr:serine protease [Actinomadura sp. J1-007]MWK36649.1 trypsin-like serine protease [Actinomadura sp. J1-007]
MNKRRLLVAVPAALPVALLTLTGTSVAQADPTPPPSPKLVGGVPASQTYSFMASLQNSAGSHNCGGTLVGASWVVTAGHCGQPYQVRIGTTNRTSGGEVRRVASRQALGGDIALLRLASPATSAPAPIATSAPVGSATRLLGWGQTCPTQGCGGAPVGLRQLDTTILADSRCSGISASTELCINGGGGRGACYGDSGGPALTGGPGSWQVVGATSRGTASSCAITPAIYTDVTAYRSQILRIIGGGAGAAR